MEEFASRLRRLRTATGLSASALAHAVGVTEGAVRQMESGQTRFPSFPVGVLLAEALGVEPRYLALGDREDPPAAGRPIDRLTEVERRLATLEKALKIPVTRKPPRAKKRR